MLGDKVLPRVLEECLLGDVFAWEESWKRSLNKGVGLDDREYVSSIYFMHGEIWSNWEQGWNLKTIYLCVKLKGLFTFLDPTSDEELQPLLSFHNLEGETAMSQSNVCVFLVCVTFILFNWHFYIKNMMLVY